MMLGGAKIKTRCPVCQASYRVPSNSIGHKARCGKCSSSFRVAEVRQSGLPTESEILDWLNEGVDEDYLAQRPRVILGGQPRTPGDPGNGTGRGHAGPTARLGIDIQGSARSDLPGESRLHAGDGLQAFRKTG